MATPNRLPTVKLVLNASQDADGRNHGDERLYFADLRLRQYRSVDGSEPWIIYDREVAGDMEEIIEKHEVKITGATTKGET
jgi:hypothetical protein